MYFSKVLLASLFGLISAAPSDLKTFVKIFNNCPKPIQVGQLGDTLVAGNDPITLSPGESKKYTFHGRWTGRFWGREDCQGSGCQVAGAAFPASLAEFTFHADSGKDFYDVSFVDGYNLPMSIKPVKPDSIDPNNQYWCGAPKCSQVPSCPPELQVVANGVYVGCQSACSKFGNPEFCCTGEFSTPDKCIINKYALQVKEGCPEAYSFAYDDNTSLYQCRASGYVISWCP